MGKDKSKERAWRRLRNIKKKFLPVLEGIEGEETPTKNRQKNPKNG